MTYVVLGSGLALLEFWVVLSQRGGATYTLPQGIRLLMPVAIALGSFRRPRAERLPIVLFAVGLGLTLNRELTGNIVVAHVAVIACGLATAWFGYGSTASHSSEQRRLVVTILLVVLGFVGGLVATLLTHGT